MPQRASPCSCGAGGIALWSAMGSLWQRQFRKGAVWKCREWQWTASGQVSLPPPAFAQACSVRPLSRPHSGAAAPGHSIRGRPFAPAAGQSGGEGAELHGWWPLSLWRRCCGSAVWQWLWSPGFYLPGLADFESISLVNFVLLSKFLYNALWLMQ